MTEKIYAIETIRKHAEKEGIPEAEAAAKLGYSEQAYRAHLFREKVRNGKIKKRKYTKTPAVVVHSPPPAEKPKQGEPTLWDSLKTLDESIKNIKRILGVAK